MRIRRVPLVAGLAATVMAIVGGSLYADLTNVAHTTAWVDAAPASPSPSPSPTPPPPPPPPTLKYTVPVRVSMPKGAVYAWALMDRRTGKITGSANSATYHNTTESMVKAWLVSDFLRRTAAAGKKPTATELTYTSTAIRDSNDNSAQWLYIRNGGNASIRRLFAMCKLTDKPAITSGWWSMTKLTARDAVRMGDCIGDGVAAGPKYTSYVLNEMRHVRGTTAAKDQHAKTGGGHWGIIDGLPDELAADTSIKNGWTLIAADGKWHLNCLAIHPDWTLAVEVRYPGRLGLSYGAGVCKSVTQQLVFQPTTAEG